MCLTVTDTTRYTAKEDIVAYKRLSLCIFVSLEGLTSGDECEAVINNLAVKGKINIQYSKLYICTNEIECLGQECINKQGYKYSWVFDKSVTLLKVKGNIPDIVTTYQTPYLDFIVEIGKTYTSECILQSRQVNKGIHSYKKEEDARKYKWNDEVIAKCIIPKGSEYYVGYFNSAENYASTAIKYVEILEDN